MGKSLFDRPHTLAVTKAQLDHLATLDLPLGNKTVLEVGAGVGQLTGFFEERGCDVYSTEGRAQNVAELLCRYPYRKNRVENVDLTIQGSHDHLGKFDIVFCYGVLYHVHDPVMVISDLARVCREMFLVSGRVFQRDNGQINLKAEDGSRADQSLYGRGCRPARNWLMAEMKKHYEYVYLTMTQPDYHEFALEWPAKYEKVRSVFVASRTELSLPTLTKELLMVQKRV